MKEWYENEQSITSLSQQIATLEQNSGLEETNQRMEEIKEEAKALWVKADESIREMVEQYFGYQKFLKRQGLELSQADKQKTKDIAKLTSEIDFLYTQMNEFDSKEGKHIQEFGDRVTYDLTGFIENLGKQMEDRKRLDYKSCRQRKKHRMKSKINWLKHLEH